MTNHHEPAIVDVGFKSNRRGGWWYREPSNRYTIQIVPSVKERRGWTLGIARPQRRQTSARVKGMQWGKRSYPSPEAAAFQAFRVVQDTGKADQLATAMQKRQEERMQTVKQRIKDFTGGSHDEAEDTNLD